MALRHAPLCTQCGQHRTLHASGMCSRCRRRPNPRHICKVCGNLTTNHETGVCHKCRRVAALYGNKLEMVLDDYKRAVTVLELRNLGSSFSDIASVIGMSKSATFEIYRRAMDLPEWTPQRDI